MSVHRQHQEHCIVYLRTAIDVNHEELEKNLSKTYKNFQIFEDPNVCINFITDLSTDLYDVFLILIGIQNGYLAEMITDLPQITNIYLYDPMKSKEEFVFFPERKSVRFWTNNFTDLYNAITRDIELKEGIPCTLSIFTSDSTTFERSVRDLCSDHQSATFVWFQLLIEVIRQLPHTIIAKEEMIIFLNEYFHDSPRQQDQLIQFSNEYQSTDAILWYTKPAFLFQVLNRAFRTQNIDNIFKLRYFLQDLYNQMEREYLEQRDYLDSITVYRGQLTSEDDFHILTRGSLIAFNSFLSTTLNEGTASIFAGSQTNINSDEVSILFQMKLISDQSSLPYASIAHLSAVRAEDEFLVAMGSVFQIDQIIENQKEKYWKVSLTLNKEVNERLTTMIKQLKEEIGNNSTLMVLGRLLGDMGDLYRAERYFRLLLNELPSDHPDLGTILNNLGIIAHKQGEHEKAIEFCERALRVLPEDHGDQACVYANIGANYQAIQDDEKAIEAYKRALQFHCFPSDQARIYNNIGVIYRRRREYTKSIEYHQLSLRFRSSADFELVTTLINLANTYTDVHDYSNALLFCEKALDKVHILPVENILIGQIHLSVGGIKASLNEHHAAVGHYSDALNACQKMTSNFTVIETILTVLYQQGQSYMELEENSLALNCFNQILSITSTRNSPHRRTAFAHQSIGRMYDNVQSFRRALDSYMIALDIWMELRQIHPDVDRYTIAELFNDIAEVYDRTKRYGYALWYYAQAIDFARGNDFLTKEYNESFQGIAQHAMKILDVHFV